MLAFARDFSVIINCTFPIHYCFCIIFLPFHHRWMDSDVFCTRVWKQDPIATMKRHDLVLVRRHIVYSLMFMISTKDLIFSCIIIYFCSSLSMCTLLFYLYNSCLIIFHKVLLKGVNFQQLQEKPLTEQYVVLRW